MKIIFAINLPYAPATGGANKTTRTIAELLAARGHEVRVVVPALPTPARTTLDDVRAKLHAEGFPTTLDDGVLRFARHGVHVAASTDSATPRLLSAEIAAHQPDWVIVSTEDPSNALMETALRGAPGRVAYFVQTTSLLPFGPMAFFPSEARARLVKQVAVTICFSEFLARYIKQHNGMESKVALLPVYGSGPYKRYGREDGYIGLINPGVIKGLPIFLQMAEARPHLRFAAVPTYATTPEDRAALTRLPNVTLLPPNENIDVILEQMRILLVPSLWQEGFPIVVVEGLLRGIPVLASDIGGTVDAKLGTKYILHARGIERFTDELDENLIPTPVIPPQDATPFLEALDELIGNPDIYARESEASRKAALAFVEVLSIEGFESILREGLASRGQYVPPVELPSPTSSALGDKLAQLTPAQRALLLKRAAGSAKKSD